MKNLILGVLFVFGFVTTVYASNGFVDLEDQDEIPTTYAGDQNSLSDEIKEELRTNRGIKGFMFNQTPLAKDELQLIGSRDDLELLSVLSCGLRRGDLKHFTSLNALQELDISHNNFTPEDLKDLSCLSNLNVFHCSGIFLEDSGMQFLSKKLSCVKDLNVSACQLSDYSLGLLLTLPRLEKVFLSGNKFSKKEMRLFNKEAQRKNIIVVL